MPSFLGDDVEFRFIRTDPSFHAHTIDSFLFPNLVRYEAKLLFETPKYKAAGYHFSSLSNNGLLLVYEHEQTIYRIRVRKADEDGHLPTQNLSETIKEFCRQPDLFLPGMEAKDWETFICPDLLSLFIVWDVDRTFGLSQCELFGHIKKDRLKIKSSGYFRS